MKRFWVRLLFVMAIGFLFRYCLVLYFTFYDVTPWGVERYLSMQGVKNVRIDWNWRLNFSHCQDPSILFGKFPMLTSICGRCEEFDVLNITNCRELVDLDVGPSGLLRNLDKLNGRLEVQVVGAVDSPIVDTNLLNTIQNSNWRISLRPTINSFHATCCCLSPEAYAELVVDFDVFSQATYDEIEMFRSQSFSDINGCDSNYFWKMLDSGVFYDVYRGKIFLSSHIK